MDSYSTVADVYLGDAQGSNVLAVGGGAVSGPPQRSQDAADALHGDASVNGVGGWWRGAGQAGAGVVVADRFHGGGQDSRHHTQHRRDADGGNTPLTCGDKRLKYSTFCQTEKMT